MKKFKLSNHVSFRVPRDLINLLKLASIEENCTVTEIIIRALRSYL